MLAEHQTAETGQGSQSRYQDGFSGALAQNAGFLLLRHPVEDVDAVGHANADDQRQRHDVGRVERDPRKPHQTKRPDRADGHGQQ